MGRGVFNMPFRDAAGNMVFVAVTSAGRRVAEMSVADETADAANAALWRLLNLAEPAAPGPRLTLERGGLYVAH